MATHASLLIVTLLASVALSRRLPDSRQEDSSQEAETDCLERSKVIRNALVDRKIPFGLADMVSKVDCKVAARMYVLDNSASMNLPGGFGPDENGWYGELARCTRWEEVKAFALEQLQDRSSTSHFALLNPTHVFYSSDSNTLTLADATRKLPDTPSKFGMPLDDVCAELRKVLVRSNETQESVDSEHLIVIATDGQPNDPDAFVKELRDIGSDFNVKGVLRLTASMPGLDDFYQDLAERVGFSIDVVDNMEAEANEAALQGNDFFVYSPAIHYVRTRGTLHRALRDLDTTLVTREQAMDIAEALVMENEACDAFPRNDLSQFVAKVSEKLLKQHLVWNPLRKQWEPPLDVTKLKKHIGL
eukprot:TRINITY_DN23489_c0_g3_i1.p1 TRINITY_DN23489_c0_g3~~TRINITY_DN23489_c0_g3_i1.p1  ORF type:complete len:360 (-),score=32.54 TRINITY_DN23489_c0_g3_i1:27-1106(-)